MAIDAIGRDALRNLDAALRCITALRVELETANLRVDAWHGNSDDWQEENERLRKALREARDGFGYILYQLSAENIAKSEREATERRDSVCAALTPKSDA